MKRTDPPRSPFADVLRRERTAARLSQMDLCERVGLSQRHLSALETSRANPSRSMVHALMDVLRLPLEKRNQLLHAAGYASQYSQSALDAPALVQVNAALCRLLRAHEPYPAVVMDGSWTLRLANAGAFRLLALTLGPRMPAEVDHTPMTPMALDMLEVMLKPGGLSTRITNRLDVLRELRSRLVTEARHNDGTQAVVDAWLPKLDQAIGARALADRSASGPQANRPVMSVNFQTPHGELGFFSTFTTFGTPLDITVGSLRIEHLFPADEACDARWRALST